jgi:hypothetical protein
MRQEARVMPTHQLGFSWAILLLGMIVAAPPAGAASPQAGKTGGPRSAYRLESSVISAGGAPGASAEHAANGSIGQPTPIGRGSSHTYLHYAGFWYACPRPGDPGAVADLAAVTNRLDQNRPNPFHPRTAITFQVAAPERVCLEIFDLSGRRIRTLVEGVLPPGGHKVFWSGTDSQGHELPSNLYVYRLQIGRFTATRKMLLLK